MAFEDESSARFPNLRRVAEEPKNTLPETIPPHDPTTMTLTTTMRCDYPDLFRFLMTESSRDPSHPSSVQRRGSYP